jgi:tetratricopeptide (TPR) repeat protein
MTAEFLFYKLDPNLLQKMRLPDLPLPVRETKNSEVFRGGSVSLDLLLEELHVFLVEQPEMNARYRNTVSTLAYVLGVESGKEGCHEIAAYYLELGLWHSPDNLSLRTNYAIALHSLGRMDDALSQYRIIMSDLDVKPSLPLWMLAARIYAEKGEYIRAYKLLRECAPLFPQENSFWEFLSEMEEKAGVVQPEKSKISPDLENLLAGTNTEVKENIQAVKTAPTAKQLSFCPRCKAKYEYGDLFCAKCGQQLKTVGKSCPSCGTVLQKDDAFCPGCGKKV